MRIWEHGFLNAEIDIRARELIDRPRKRLALNEPIGLNGGPLVAITARIRQTAIDRGGAVDDEQAIRTLIERWAAAAHAGDMQAVLSDHAPDIVMFDVSPPHRGVRGLDAYRETWPGFFEWQAAGATFDIESLEIVAGTDAAFAYALLRCGTAAEFAADPDRRLRLTVGLRKIDDRWVVTHEHHSFADASEPA